MTIHCVYIILWFVFLQIFSDAVPPSPTDSLMGDVREIKENLNRLIQNSQIRFLEQFVQVQNMLTSIDSNVKNLQERAHVWDTFQLHVSAWNDQLSTTDRKLDILSKAQEKIFNLDTKFDIIQNVEFKLDQLTDRILAIEGHLQEIKVDDKRDVNLFGEFATRGILSTLKQVEKKVDRINVNNQNVKQLFGKNGKCQADDILKDISSKVDVIFDKFSEKDEAVEEGYFEDQGSGDSNESKLDDEKLLRKVLKRLYEPCKKTSKVLDKILVSVENIENDTSSILNLTDNCRLKPHQSIDDVTPSTVSNIDYTYCYTVQNLTGVIHFLKENVNDTNRDYNTRVCDKGWTIIQKRDYYNLQENFNRTWDDYKKGFGELHKDFWFGNDFIHKLSSENDLKLRIELENFDGIKVWAEYNIFQVGNESDFYKIEIGDYNGTASDSFSSHNMSKFSTFDKKNDDAPICCPCALSYGSGWWFNSCFESNLNGLYYKNPLTNEYYKGIIWEHWLGNYSLKKTRMMVRPKGNVRFVDIELSPVFIEDP